MSDLNHAIAFILERVHETEDRPLHDGEQASADRSR